MYKKITIIFLLLSTFISKSASGSYTHFGNEDENRVALCSVIEDFLQADPREERYYEYLEKHKIKREWIIDETGTTCEYGVLTEEGKKHIWVKENGYRNNKSFISDELITEEEKQNGYRLETDDTDDVESENLPTNQPPVENSGTSSETPEENRNTSVEDSNTSIETPEENRSTSVENSDTNAKTTPEENRNTEVEDSNTNNESQKKENKVISTVDIKQYKEIANSFYKIDNTISNYLDNDVYFDFEIGPSFLSNKNIIPIVGTNLGISKKISKLDLKIGTYFRYKYDKSNNLSIGISFKNKDLVDYLQYTVSLLKDGENKFIRHHIENYLKYSKEFKIIENIRIKPSLGLNLLYGTKVKFNETDYISDKFYGILNLGLNINYRKADLLLYFEPEFSLKYGYQKLYINSESNNQPIDNIEEDYFFYNIVLGINKEMKNGINIGTSIKIKGDYLNNTKLILNGNIGYIF